MTASFFGYLSSLNPFVKCCLFRKQEDKSLVGIELLLFSSAPVLLSVFAIPAFAAPLPQIAQIAQVSITRPNLQLGSQGQPVSELQSALKLLGFYTGVVDGIYNEATAKAVSQFQQAAGLNANGIVDTITWQKLFPGEAIASASSPPPTSTTTVTNSASNFPVPTQIVNNSTTTTTQTANNSTTTTTQTANNSTALTTPPEPKPATPPKQTTSTNSQKKTVTQSSSNRSQQSTRTQQSTRSTRSQSTQRTQPTPRFEQIPGVQYTSKGYPILRPGMSNAEVRRLQLRLRKLGYLKSDADGDFGKETEAAVQTLQKRYDIEPDGVVGGATWEILLRRR